MKQILFVFLLTWIAIGCNQGPPPKTEPVKKPENINEHVTKLLKKYLEKAESSTIINFKTDTLVAVQKVKSIYTWFHYNPIWTDKGVLGAEGDTLLRILKQASVYGLIPSNYYVNQIDSLLHTEKNSKGEVDAVMVTNAELFLTDGLFKMAVHLNKGRLNPDSLWKEWKINKVDTNLLSLVANAIRKNAIRAALDSMEPRHEQYKKLKIALSDFRKEFENNNWDSLPPIEQDTPAFYNALQNRLIQSHHFDTTLKVNDEKKLAKALKKFQLEHALNDDGRVGKFTYSALNVSKENQIRQIELNMERWRWESATGKRYLWVNIPSFKLKVIDSDTLYSEVKVITGSTKHPTPLLKGTISYFIIYPYWNVPYKIASEEILPRIQWDTTYLRKNNFDVLDWNNQVVDAKKIYWKKYNKTNLPYHFRQQEGQDNSLGVIKFMFNNPFGVYLHDTNSKRLFGKEVRALSHGCVRMENPWILANYLIQDEKKYNTDSLFEYYIKEQKKTIPLHKPLPLYIKYFTCEVDTNDRLLFYTDIYEKDKKMLKTLYK